MSSADSPPFSLSDAEMTAVMRAAEALQLYDRGPFLEMVAEELRDMPARELGPGSLHRILRETQGQFLLTRPVLAAGKPDGLAKYRRSSDWIRKPTKRRRAPAEI